MPCLICESQNQAAFPAEMIIHFSGRTNRDKLGVCAFPKLIVCMDCGFSCFATPRTELAVLARSVLNRKASTWLENAEGAPHTINGNALRETA